MKIKIMKATLNVVSAEKVTASAQSDLTTPDKDDFEKVISNNEKKQNTRRDDGSSSTGNH